MQANKKIVAALILPALLPACFAVFFIISQWKIRHDMKEKLENENLISLTVKTTDIIWVDMGEEALVNGKMFDVASYQQSGASIELKGLYDTVEDNLHVELQRLMQQKNGQQKNLVKLLHWQLFTNPITDYSFRFYKESSKNIHPYQMPFWVNCSYAIQKPPALA